MHENQLRGRVSAIHEWLDLLEVIYEDLLSRPEETASTSGFDPSPRKRPCECRASWRRGKLCLACDNTRWRALTAKEREEKLGVDPYSAQVSSGVTVVRDESPSSRRARELRRLDASISALERDARIRAGLDVQEGRDARTFRRVAKKHHTLNKILVALAHLREQRYDLYLDLRGKGAVALALLVPGRIEKPAEALR